MSSGKESKRSKSRRDEGQKKDPGVKKGTKTQYKGPRADQRYPLYYTLKKPSPSFEVTQSLRDELAATLSNLEDERVMEAVVGIICEHAWEKKVLEVDIGNISFPYGCKQEGYFFSIPVDSIPGDLVFILLEFLKIIL